MKKVFCILLCLIFVCLCGCKSINKEALSNINEKIGATVNDFIKSGETILAENGFIVNESVDEDNVKKVKETAVSANGLSTIYYEALTKKQQSIYRILLTVSNEMTDGWVYCGKDSDSAATDISVAYRAFLCDNPQIFWMPPSYLIAKCDGGELCVAFKQDSENYENDYLISKSAKAAAVSELEQRTGEYVAAALRYTTEYDRELFVHDQLLKNVVYDDSFGEMIYASYGALVDGRCVCEGYSRAFQLIMQRLNIKCTLVYGEFESNGHMWNLVNIGGEWYHIDVTWDNSDKFGTTHEYFNLTDSEMLTSHTLSPEYKKGSTVSEADNYNIVYYPCVGTQYNYFEKNGYYISNDTNITANAVYNAYQNGTEFAELKNIGCDDIESTLLQVKSRLRWQVSMSRFAVSGTIVFVYF